MLAINPVGFAVISSTQMSIRNMKEYGTLLYILCYTNIIYQNEFAASLQNVCRCTIDLSRAF